MTAYVGKKKLHGCTPAGIPVNSLSEPHPSQCVVPPHTHRQTDRIAVSSFIKFPNNDLSA